MMRRQARVRVLLVGAVVFAGGGVALVARGSDSSAANSVDAVAAGESTYRHLCSHCHGFKLVSAGAGAPDLRLFPASDKARFVNTVLNGKGAMPPWKESLSPEVVEALWSYVIATREVAGS